MKEENDSELVSSSQPHTSTASLSKNKTSRLLSFLFGNDEGRFFTKFADEQRLIRLDMCAADLLPPLKACLAAAAAQKEKEKEDAEKKGWFDRNQKTKSAVNTDTPEKTARLEDTKSGKKIIRYFHWNNDYEKLDSSPPSSPYSQMATVVLGKDSTEPKQHPEEVSFQRHIVSQSPTTTHEIESTQKVNCTKETHALYACRALALGCAADVVLLKKCFASGKECIQEQQRIAHCIDVNRFELNKRLQHRHHQS